MKRLLLIFFVLLAPLTMLATSRRWVQCGGAGSYNVSDATHWQCTSGCSVSTCGNGDAPGYPSVNGDTVTLGASYTLTDDLSTVSWGDTAAPTVYAITMANNATFIVDGKTVNIGGSGVTFSGSSGAKLSLRNATTWNCTSTGTTNNYCPAYLYNATSGTNTVEICGNFSGGVCVTPTENALGYLTSTCPQRVNIVGDGTIYVGPKSFNIPSNATPPLLWKGSCWKYSNTAYTSSEPFSPAFQVFDFNDVILSGVGFGFDSSDSSCYDVIHRVHHLTILGSTMSNGKFPITMNGCTGTPPGTWSTPQEFRFIATDNAEKLLVFGVGGKNPWKIDHYVGAMQLSFVNNQTNLTWTTSAYIPYTATIYSGAWGYWSIATAISSNVVDGILVAPYSTSTPPWATAVGINEDGTVAPTLSGPNIYRNIYTDGWGQPGVYKSNIQTMCNALIYGNISFNGAGRLSVANSNRFPYNKIYAGCRQYNSPQGANVGMVANFNTCYASSTTSIAGVPDCITTNVTNYPFPDPTPTNDGANDISGNIFASMPAGISQAGQGANPFNPAIRQGYLNYDYNAFTGMTRNGNYKTAAGVNGYLANPNNALLGTGLTITSVAAASAGVTVYTGTITGGASNNLAGVWFGVTGCANGANNTAANVLWKATASSLTTLTLSNPAGVVDSSSTCVITQSLGGAVTKTQAATCGDTPTCKVGPFHLSSAPAGIQVGDVFCITAFTTTPVACGVISAIGSDGTCSTCAVTVGGPTLWTTTPGEVGVGQTVPNGNTVAMYPKYTADTNPDYGGTNRGANDLALDPKFTDSGCTLAKYDTLQGGPGSYANNAQSFNANAVAAVNGIDLTGATVTPNPAYRLEPVFAYLKRCWTPTNMMLKNAVKDGTRCTQAGRGDGTGQCDPGALPISVGAILNQ